MKYIIYFFGITVLLGINLGLFGNLQIKDQIPNLLFLTALCFVLEKKDYDFFFIALVSGLFLDFYSTGFFGSYSIAFLIVCFVLHAVVNNIVAAELNWKTLILALIFCLFLLDNLVWLYGLIAFKFGFFTYATGYKTFMQSYLPSLFYNLLLLYPVYLYSNYLKRLVDNLNLKRRGIINR